MSGISVTINDVYGKNPTIDDNMIGNIVYILLPNRIVSRGKVLERVFDGSYRVVTDDGPSFCRYIADIFIDEDMARAKKFIDRYKMKMHHGFSSEEAWASEDEHIVELAIKKWPEKFV